MHDARASQGELLSIDADFITMLSVGKTVDLEDEDVDSLLCIFLLVDGELFVSLLFCQFSLFICINMFLMSFGDLAVDPYLDSRGILYGSCE